jgi:hypothetical protein
MLSPLPRRSGWADLFARNPAVSAFPDMAVGSITTCLKCHNNTAKRYDFSTIPVRMLQWTYLSVTPKCKVSSSMKEVAEPSPGTSVNHLLTIHFRLQKMSVAYPRVK